MYTCWEIQGCGILIVLVTIYSASQKSLNLTREYALVARLDNARVAVLFRRVVYAKAHAKRATSLPALVRYTR